MRSMGWKGCCIVLDFLISSRRKKKRRLINSIWWKVEFCKWIFETFVLYILLCSHKSLMKLLYILEYMLAQNLWRSSGYLLWNYFWLSSYSWKCIRSSNFSDFQEKALLSSYLLKAHYYISAKGHNLHIRIKFCNYSKVMKCQTSFFSPHFCNMQ